MRNVLTTTTMQTHIQFSDLVFDVVDEIVNRADRCNYHNIAVVNKLLRKIVLKKIISISTPSLFEQACEGGDLLSIILSPYKKYDWDDGLRYACRGGHPSVVKLMISKGANDWNSGLRQACLKCHMHIVKLMITKANDGQSMIGMMAYGMHVKEVIYP